MIGLGSPVGRSTSSDATRLPIAPASDGVSARTLIGTRARTTVLGPTASPRVCSQTRSAPARTASTTSLTVVAGPGSAERDRAWKARIFR